MPIAEIAEMPIKKELNKQAIEEFVQRLCDAEGDNLLRAVLFGSVARGDDNEDSDIDIFIILKNDDSAIHDRICDIKTDVNVKWGTYISLLIDSEETYLKDKKCSLVYYDIRDEGWVLYEKHA